MIGGYATSRGNGCTLLPRFAHFSMTHEAIDLARRKLMDGHTLGTAFTYQLTMQMVTPCNASGRAPVTAMSWIRPSRRAGDGASAASDPSDSESCYQLKRSANVPALLMECGESCAACLELR